MRWTQTGRLQSKRTTSSRSSWTRSSCACSASGWALRASHTTAPWRLSRGGKSDSAAQSSRRGLSWLHIELPCVLTRTCKFENNRVQQITPEQVFFELEESLWVVSCPGEPRCWHSENFCKHASLHALIAPPLPSIPSTQSFGVAPDKSYAYRAVGSQPPSIRVWQPSPIA